MLSEEYERMMLLYLSSLVDGDGFQTIADLERLSSRELLELAQKVDNSALGLFVQLLKHSGSGTRLFERLMGEHEEDNRDLVDTFFRRYLSLVLSNEEETRHYNPLEVYLPRQTFDDLAFIQSRQAVFLRQTIETINDYLKTVLRCRKRFEPGDQQKAWEWFWETIMEK